MKCSSFRRGPERYPRIENNKNRHSHHICHINGTLGCDEAKIGYDNSGDGDLIDDGHCPIHMISLGDGITCPECSAVRGAAF